MAAVSAVLLAASCQEAGRPSRAETKEAKERLGRLLLPSGVVPEGYQYVKPQTDTQRWTYRVPLNPYITTRDDCAHDISQRFAGAIAIDRVHACLWSLYWNPETGGEIGIDAMVFRDEKAAGKAARRLSALQLDGRTLAAQAEGDMAAVVWRNEAASPAAWDRMRYLTFGLLKRDPEVVAEVRRQP